MDTIVNLFLCLGLNSLALAFNSMIKIYPNGPVKMLFLGLIS